MAVDTNSRRQVQQFLRLPFRLYTDVRQWVPPLAPDARLLSAFNLLRVSRAD